jgi:hypothetical protein
MRVIGLLKNRLLEVESESRRSKKELREALEEIDRLKKEKETQWKCKTKDKWKNLVQNKENLRTSENLMEPCEAICLEEKEMRKPLETRKTQKSLFLI